MQKQLLNYRIIIEPEKMGKKVVYNAYCPTLGVADYGSSIDEAFKNIRLLIKFHIESLLEDSVEIPSENTDEEVITSTKVSIQGYGSNIQVAVG